MGKNKRPAQQKHLKHKLNQVRSSNFNKQSPMKANNKKKQIRRPPSSSFKKFGTHGDNFEFKVPNPMPRENKKSRMYLREDQVAISEFVSEGSGFFGVCKSKCSDFIVNEIDGNGKVLHLTNVTIPIMMGNAQDKEEPANAQAEDKADEKQNKWNFPGEYTHFLVYTENLNTCDAIRKLAENMSINLSEISYCSTKERLAKSTQKFCIKRREPSEIASAAQNTGMRVGNFEFSNQALKLGDTKGDRYRISLRYIRGNDQIMEKSLINLRENGFINYFGLKRFGHHQGTLSHEAGAALLKSDYKTVCELIMKPRAQDLPFMVKIRKLWWENRDSAAAAAMFRMDDFVEKKLLNGLVEYGEEEYDAALKKLPANMLLLYPNAFQSLVFNRIASRRIEKFGMQLLPGDFVYLNKDEMDEFTLDYDELPDYENDVDNEEMEESDGNDVVDTFAKGEVKPLTEEDIASGEYTIHDVVLPLPGYNVTYPVNEVGNWYEEILQEYGLSIDDLINNITSYSLPGSYRKLLMRPSNFTWRYRKYAEADEHLVATDWDHITGSAVEIEGGRQFADSKGLLLDFCLPPTSYVPVLLRELLKLDKAAPVTNIVIRYQ